MVANHMACWCSYHTAIESTTTYILLIVITVVVLVVVCKSVDIIQQRWSYGNSIHIYDIMRKEKGLDGRRFFFFLLFLCSCFFLLNFFSTQG